MSRKRKLVLFFAPLLALGLAISMWPLYPLQLKKTIINTTSTTEWSRYQRLTRLLDLGMESNEVRRILGEPTRIEKVTSGESWTYLEDDATTGWSYLAQLRLEKTTGEAPTVLKLCFVENIEHSLFPKAKQFRMGDKLK